MGGVRARRATPRRRTAPREDRDWWETITPVLLARCGWRCERCGQPLVDNLERHHRQKRVTGGDRLANIVGLHTVCHAWVHAHPAESRDSGLIVSSYAADPAEVPVWIGGVRWLLDDEGGRERVL